MQYLDEFHIILRIQPALNIYVYFTLYYILILFHYYKL